MNIQAHPLFRPNRLLSRPVSNLLLRTPIKPNHVTVLSAAFGAVAGMLFSHDNYLSGLAAAGCYQTAVVLDNCDGEIARAKNMKSPLGAWLDILADFTTDLALFTGLALGLHRNSPGEPALLLGSLCAFGACMHLLLVVLEKRRGFGPAAFATPNPDIPHRSRFFWKVFDALREGEASWLVLLFAVWGAEHWMLYFGAVYMQVLWVTALVVNFKWLRAAR